MHVHKAQSERPSILVVDDTPENIDILKGVLKEDYTVRPAPNGRVALRIAEASPPPDIILLDIMMPGMDGYAVMQHLQENPRTRSIPVIFITALADMDSEIKGLRAGAVDYVTKPFNPLAVCSRVATHLALSRIRRMLEQRTEELMYERQVVEDVIARMRSSPYFDDRHLRYRLDPVERTSGDILLATFAPDGRQWLLVGDFTGHGLSAAVAAPLISHVFYGCAARNGDVEGVIEAINDVMCRQLPAEMYMAAAIVEVAQARDRLRVWNGGMPECLLVDSRRELRQVIEAGVLPPFGIHASVDVTGSRVACEVSPGDRLYLFSDGVTEAADPDGRCFGIERVERFVTQSASAMPLDGLTKALEEFRGSDVFDDDMTIVELSVS